MTAGRGPSICLFGLGEAGSLLAADLWRAGATVSAYDPAEVGTPEGVVRHVHPALAVRHADLVLGLTAGSEAKLALLQALEAIGGGAVYADLSTASPQVKSELAGLAARQELEFVDVALMAAVPGNGLATPALAAGEAAARLAGALNPLGARIEPVDGPPGAAAGKKLLRSVMTKGTAAVLIEAVRAGAAADDLAWLWSNMARELDGADEWWMRHQVTGSKAHARRRRDEMTAAVEMLEGLGVAPTMTRSTVASLDELVAGALPDLPPPRRS